MKIGILTFHSQLNYGGVLQCWALQRALQAMGHDVVVIDRWMDPENERLMGPLGKVGWKTRITWIARSILCCGNGSLALREWKTMQFLKKIGLTKYHFYDWSEAPKNLGIDCIVVGSDQLWHGGDWGDPRPYLLEGAPNVPAIAYAISLGQEKLPKTIDYHSGFARFKAISMREQEAVDVIQSEGFDAVQVLDPTLLLHRDVWRRYWPGRKTKGTVVCYLLAYDLNDSVAKLRRLAKEGNYSVEVLIGNVPLLPISSTIHNVVKFIQESLPGNRVRVHASYGPKEFVDAFSRAEYCITDSFHGIMFSSIFDCVVKSLRPKSAVRKSMFARVEELGNWVIRGRYIYDGIDDAVDSILRSEKCFYSYEDIALRRKASEHWLEQSLELVK